MDTGTGVTENRPRYQLIFYPCCLLLSLDFSLLPAAESEKIDASQLGLRLPLVTSDIRTAKLQALMLSITPLGYWYLNPLYRELPTRV